MPVIFPNIHDVEKTSIHLGKFENATVLVEKNEYRCTANFFMKLQPTPGISFTTQCYSMPSTIYGKKAKIFISPDICFDCFCTKSGTNFSNADGCNWTYEWVTTYSKLHRCGSNNSKMKEIKFQLYNFTNYLQMPFHNNKTLFLKDNVWDIRIEPLDNIQEKMDFLRNNRGYQQTHAGIIKRRGSQEFNGKTAFAILKNLESFLTFVNGNRVTTVNPTGIDNSESIVWQEWRAPSSMSAWKYVPQCFDAQHPEQVESFFPLYMKLCRKKNWSETFEEVIDWYSNANQSSFGIGACIILAQNALEKLSFEYLVNDKCVVTQKQFRDKSASQKIREALELLLIPLRITNFTPSLQKLARPSNNNWDDAAHAFTEIRNSLVHPNHKIKRLPDTAYMDSWYLGIWLIEMFILALVGYQGTYNNRFCKGKLIGTVENVPWR